MKQLAAAFLAGLVFGLGLTVSQMTNPAKVIGFLDIFGDWDPSLALVMAGALAVTIVGYRLAWRMPKPAFAQNFELPGNRRIDTKLAIGALLFGIGWGLAGLCPGPAIAGLTVGGRTVLEFLAAMAAGTLAFDLSPLGRRRSPGAGGDAGRAASSA